MHLIIKQILGPIIRRVGAVTSGYLIGQGIPQDDVTAIITGLTLGLAVIYDLLAAAYIEKKRELR